MNAAGMRQRPIATWEQEETTCEYAFDPGTLPPGAQSLGEHESVVSHTNPRVSRAVFTHLDRLIQAIWTEPCQEDVRNGGNSDDPHADDTGMQVDNDNASERTAMSVDRVPEEVQANTHVTAGATGEEQESGRTHPLRPPCGAEGAQAGRDCRSTENLPEGSNMDTYTNQQLGGS